MGGQPQLELRRRSVTKSLVWRIIGVLWTWTGAYLIFLFTPERYKSASIMATAIVVYHHSTRMVMYYIYERIWTAISWGRLDKDKLDQVAMTVTVKVVWISAVVLALIGVFLLVLYIQPIIRK